MHEILDCIPQAVRTSLQPQQTPEVLNALVAVLDVQPQPKRRIRKTKDFDLQLTAGDDFKQLY